MSANIVYTLFLYRKELENSSVSERRLKKRKLVLTDKLVRKGAEALETCSGEYLRTISREVKYKKQLIRQLQEMGKKKISKKQN